MPYSPQASFTDYQASNPGTPLPGSDVDIELRAIGTVIDVLERAIGDLRRGDGALNNGIVTVDALAPGLRPGTGGVDPQVVEDRVDTVLAPTLADVAARLSSADDRLADAQALLDGLEAQRGALLAEIASIPADVEADRAAAQAALAEAQTEAGNAATSASEANASASTASTAATTATDAATSASADADRAEAAQAATVAPGRSGTALAALYARQPLLARFPLLLDFAGQGYVAGDRGGPTAPLLFDGVMPDFARASQGTAFGADGDLDTYAVDEPRSDHDPVTGEWRGFLIEGQVANLLANPAAPATQSVSVTAQAYTLAFYGDGTVTLSGAHSATVNGTDASTRTTLTFTPSAGSLTLTISGTVENADLQAGSFITSHIPFQGTRAADSAVINGLDTAPWFQQGQGTLFFEIDRENIGIASRVIELCDFALAVSPRFQVTVFEDGEVTLTIVDDTGTTVASGERFGYTDGIFRGAIAWDENGFSLAGPAGLRSGLANTPTNIDRLFIGQNRAGIRQLDGHFRTLGYAPPRFPDADLTALVSGDW